MSTDRRLSRGEASEATGSLGWRFVLGALRTQVPAADLADAAAIATAAIASGNRSAQDHLTVDIRGDRVLLRLQSPDGGVFESDAAVARAITAGLASQGRVTSLPPNGAGNLQAIEIAIDALDIAAIRPFWKAVTGYVDEPGAGPEDGLIDPLGCGPPIWFQQMDAARPQRNRIHLDISVPHDVAQERLDAALRAGGELRSAAAAPAFWVLADAEGNEACVCTWQGRD